MRVLVTGGAGMLGKTLVEQLSHKHQVSYTAHLTPVKSPSAEAIECDLTRLGLNFVDFEAVVHTAAMTNVDQCQEHPELAYQSNVMATRNVTASAPGAHIVYISTDFIFNGKKGNYSEEDEPLPLSVYGQTKLQGEGEIPNGGCIIRTSIYGLGSSPEKPGMVEKMVNRLKNGEIVSGFTDQLFTPVSTGNMALFIEEILARRLGGIFNIGSSQSYTKYEFIRSAATAFGFDPERVKPGLSSSVKYLAPRPRDVSLDTAKAQKVFRTKVWDLKQSFESIKLEWEARQY